VWREWQCRSSGYDTKVFARRGIWVRYTKQKTAVLPRDIEQVAFLSDTRIANILFFSLVLIVTTRKCLVVVVNQRGLKHSQWRKRNDGNGRRLQIPVPEFWWRLVIRASTRGRKKETPERRQRWSGIIPRSIIAGSLPARFLRRWRGKGSQCESRIKSIRDALPSEPTNFLLRARRILSPFTFIG